MQFRDLKKQYDVLKKDIDAGVLNVMSSGSFILGSAEQELEAQLADYAGRKHCIGVANGTDALILSLKAHGVGPGDAVFVADFTYIASASCIAHVGASPVFVDIDINTFNICPAALEEAVRRVLKEGKLTPKAVIPVDLFGLPADFNRILPIAEKYGLLVLEDAAQGFGGRINGKTACSFGDISATSFFPAKPLGCYGDGGAIFTDDDALDARLRSLRAGGKSPTDKYDNREIGYNSRLDTIQAAVLIPKLKAFAEYELNAVNKAAEWYTERLKGKLKTPYVPKGFLSSWAQYTIRLESREMRDRIQAKLKEAGIPTMVYYPRGMHQQQVFKYLNLPDKLYPNTTIATQTVLSLPMHPYLEEETVEYIAATLINSI